MIRSMTGFGEAERDSPAGRLRIEVKTVNHRFFNASVKTPSGFDRYEPAITDALKRHLSRGHVTAYLSLKRNGAGGDTGIRADLDRARAYLKAFEALRDELNVSGTVNLDMLSRYGDLFHAPESDRTGEIEPELVAELTEAAASGARALREAEGERLEADLSARLDAIAVELAAVAARAPERLVEQRDRLREAVRELTEQVEVDEDRLAREIAYLAERWDINEEVVRFRSHVELFREALAGDGAEPVGKRLGFLAQEMHREANTIGSKANDAELARASVALKEEIERIREQVENVE
ncbi:MAG TPA: YicC/YloC family endoribonuclease [Longimicrobiales bacterium]|nr:YicC/YloC family endoribonuclease [Longimicrobiales bacterium]